LVVPLARIFQLLPLLIGYTYCPDVCPLTLADLKKALTDLGGRERVHPIFISVDPERDIPAVPTRYLTTFDSDFIGLTDDFEKIEAAMRPFGAFTEKEEVTGSAAEYLVSHTGRVYLISPNHEILLTYSFGFRPEELRSDLIHLLQQEDL
jgi:protein SCO1/2